MLQQLLPCSSSKLYLKLTLLIKNGIIETGGGWYMAGSMKRIIDNEGKNSSLLNSCCC